MSLEAPTNTIFDKVIKLHEDFRHILTKLKDVHVNDDLHICLSQFYQDLGTIRNVPFAHQNELLISPMVECVNCRCKLKGYSIHALLYEDAHECSYRSMCETESDSSDDEEQEILKDMIQSVHSMLPFRKRFATVESRMLTFNPYYFTNVSLVRKLAEKHFVFTIW